MIAIEFAPEEVRTDMTIIIDGDEVATLTDVGPEEGNAHIALTNVFIGLGLPVEYRFSNPDVANIAREVYARRDNVTVSVMPKAA
ncbi:hypothetical protein [Azorhizobium caulinodans]|nr:hypothetical protein [Azorhizobium caulinodans]